MKSDTRFAIFSQFLFVLALISFPAAVKLTGNGNRAIALYIGLLVIYLLYAVFCVKDDSGEAVETGDNLGEILEQNDEEK